LSQRLRHNAGGRPSLTGGAVADEVAQVLAVREPLYHAVADAVLDGTMPIVSLVTALVGLVENSG
jgi:shikimate kinase